MSEQQLPDAPQWIYDNIAEVSRMAKRVFNIYIFLVLYTIMTVATVSDRQILLNGTVRLPIFAVDVSLIGFLAFSPASILGAYFYLQLYLGRLKGLVAQLRTNYPSVPRRRLYPWIFNLAIDPDPGLCGWGQRFFVAFSQIGLIVVVFYMIGIVSSKMHSRALALSFLIVLTPPILYYFLRFGYSVVISAFRGKAFPSKNPLRAVTALFSGPEFIASALVLVITALMALPFVYSSLSAIRIIPPFSSYIDISYQRLVAPPELEFQGSFWLYLDNAKLYKAKMHYTDVRRTYFLDADLKGADARHSNFACCYLRRARLDGAFFDAAILDSTVFDSASMMACVFSNTRFRWASLDSCQASGSDFRHADLSKSTFMGAKLDSCRFDSTNLLDCNFTHADLSFANLQGANVYNVNFTGANLYRTNLTGVTNLSFGELEKAATLCEAILDDDCRAHIQRVKPSLLRPPTNTADP